MQVPSKSLYCNVQHSIFVLCIVFFLCLYFDQHFLKISVTFANVFKVLNEHYHLPNAEKVLSELQEDKEGRDNTKKLVEDATDFDVCIREETILSRKRKFEVIEKDIDAVEDLIKLVEDSLSNKLSKKGVKGAKQLKRNNNMEKKCIQFYLVTRKAVKGSVM